VVAIVAALSSFIPFLGIPLPMIAVVLSIVAFVSDGNAGRGRGMSTAALIVSICAVLVSLLISLVVGILIARNSNTVTSVADCVRQANEQNWTETQLRACLDDVGRGITGSSSY
jgi:hypothetical protein